MRDSLSHRKDEITKFAIDINQILNNTRTAKPKALYPFYFTTNVLIKIDDYAKNGRPGEIRLLCSFYQESLRTWIKTTANKFAISNHTALILCVHALRSYLKLICEYELHSLPNKS